MTAKEKQRGFVGSSQGRNDLGLRSTALFAFACQDGSSSATLLARVLVLCEKLREFDSPP